MVQDVPRVPNMYIFVRCLESIKEPYLLSQCLALKCNAKYLFPESADYPERLLSCTACVVHVMRIGSCFMFEL